MMSMVERVAVAVNGAYLKASQSPEGLEYHLARGLSLVAARAAIEAMREPTKLMVEAGAVSCGEDSEATAIGAWEGMIDAALNEQVAG